MKTLIKTDMAMFLLDAVSDYQIAKAFLVCYWETGDEEVPGFCWVRFGIIKMEMKQIKWLQNQKDKNKCCKR